MSLPDFHKQILMTAMTKPVRSGTLGEVALFYVRKVNKLSF